MVRTVVLKSWNQVLSKENIKRAMSEEMIVQNNVDEKYLCFMNGDMNWKQLLNFVF